MLKRGPFLVAVATVVCVGVSGCFLNVLESEGPGINVKNETAMELVVEYANGMFTNTLPPGALGAMPVLNDDECSTLVVRFDGSDFATLSDDRLCDDNTQVVIRGESDMVIVDNR